MGSVFTSCDLDSMRETALASGLPPELEGQESGGSGACGRGELARTWHPCSCARQFKELWATTAREVWVLSSARVVVHSSGGVHQAVERAAVK